MTTLPLRDGSTPSKCATSSGAAGRQWRQVLAAGQGVTPDPNQACVRETRRQGTQDCEEMESWCQLQWNPAFFHYDSMYSYVQPDGKLVYSHSNFISLHCEKGATA
ncbi:unnamed protein product [Urochloa humidicola]